MSFRRLGAIARKELHHIWRDRSTLVLVLFTPTALLFLMAYALTVEIQHVPVAVLDYGRSATSRTFVQHLTAGDDLDLYAQVDSPDEIEAMLMRGEIKAALILPPDFDEALLALRGLPLQIIIDGTEPESGGFAVAHMGQRAEQFVGQLLAADLQAAGLSAAALQPIDLRVRTWYNPSLKSRNDLIPGLISIVLGFPALTVALTLAHEREHGTMEQLMATPVGRSELLLGKMVPYVVVGLLNAIFIPLLALLWFKVPFNGNFLLFFGLSAIFLFAILGVGLVIGVFMRSQAAALALSFLLIFFPGFFMTGIFFPTVAMPEIVRLEALGLPGTHYAVITRGIFLPGVGLEVLWPYAVMLFGLGVAFVGVAALFFRKKLA
ncbi:MAG: ABC transporter permease [Ardenticatenaceae bacterium]|nr:ABC transporter permease [Ardenticatenaceae bacterium]